MPKISNKDIYNQDDTLSMNDYTIGSNSNTGNKKTQTYTFASIFSLFYNFLGYNAFLNTTDTTTYPIGTPGCFYVFDENDDLTSDFSEARKITFSSYDTYNFDTANYFNIIVSSGKFLFKLINLEDKNNFVFLSPSNFVLSGTGTTFNVDVLAEAGLSNGSFVNYKRYLLVLEFAAGTFNPADYDLTDFTNTSGDPFVTAQDLTDALSLLPTPITNHSELSLDDGTNPHGTTKADLGLGNVDNTSDLNKPISTATQTALNLKQDKLTETNFGQFMDVDLATKLTPSPNDTISGRDFVTNKAVELNYPIAEGYFNGTNFYLESSFVNLIQATTGRTYIDLATNLQYRWSGSAYVKLSSGIDFPTSDNILYGVKNGIPTELTDELYRSWFSYMPNNAGSWLVVNTGNPLTISGTASVVPRSGTTIYGSIIMNNCVSATPNGSNAGIKNNNASDGVYLEGVDAYFMWANNDSNNQCCTTVGLYSLLSAIPNLDPSNFTAQTVIVGNDVGDTNLSFYVNRTGAPASFVKVPTNSSFPANSTTDAYLLRIQISKTLVDANRTAKLTLINIVTGAVFTHSFTGAQLPTSATNFSVVINRSNRNTGIATNTRPSKIYVNRKLF